MGGRFAVVFVVHHALGEEYSGATLVNMYLAEWRRMPGTWRWPPGSSTSSTNL